MSGLANTPTIDELIASPEKAASLSPVVARTLLFGLAGVLPALAAIASKEAAKTDSVSTPERWLTIDQVVNQFGVTKPWLYRHKRHLPHSQPTRKKLIFPEERLRRWFASRKAS